MLNEVSPTDNNIIAVLASIVFIINNTKVAIPIAKLIDLKI